MLWLTWQYRQVGMTADVVSGGAGIHPDRLRMIEAGEIVPTYGELENLARVTGWQANPTGLMAPVPDFQVENLERWEKERRHH